MEATGKSKGYDRNDGKWDNGGGNKSNNSDTNCSHCGGQNHISSRCRYKGSTCFSCGRIGHLKYVCRRNGDNSVKFLSDDYDVVNDDYDTVNVNYSVFNIGGCNSNETYRLPVLIDGTKVEADCDTGSPCPLISRKF